MNRLIHVHTLVYNMHIYGIKNYSCMKRYYIINNQTGNKCQNYVNSHRFVHIEYF